MANDLEVGRVIARFRLERRLGAGQMGVVYEATDLSLRRAVALKLLPTRVDRSDPSPETDRRFKFFLREARSVAALDHPHIIRIYEIGLRDGWCFIAMELVQGVDLQRVLERWGPLSWRRTVKLGAEAAEALAHAHACGIFHRDIKPANLMMDRLGRCKLTDFGLSQRAGVVGDRISPAVCVGTPSYVSPEVARGLDADGRSDLYSLGATLWHILCGRAPFVDPNVRRVLQMHLNRPAPDPREYCPGLPPRVAAAVLRSMAKRPQERFASAQQMAEELRHACEDCEDALTERESRCELERLASAAAAATAVWAPAARASSRSARGSVNGPSGPQPFSAATAAATAPGGPARRRASSRGLRWLKIGAAFTLVSGAVASGLMLPGLRPAAPFIDPQPVGQTVPSAGAAASAHAADPVAVAHRLFGVSPAGSLTAGDVARMIAIIEADDQRPYLVEGRVTYAETSRSGKTLYLRLDGRESVGDFQAVCTQDLHPAMQERFGGEAGTGIKDSRVRILGPIRLYRGSPQIAIRSPDQIIVISDR